MEPLSFEDTQVAFSAKSDSELKRSYRLFQLFSFNELVKVGSWATNLAMRLQLPISPLVKYTIFHQFCGGETLKDTETTVEQLARSGINSILDYGVEAKNNERDFDNALQHHLKTLQYAKTHPHITIISAKITGLGRFAMLEKAHAKEKLTAVEKEEFERIRQRLHQLCQAASISGTSIFFDAEETWIQQPLDDLIEEMMQQHNHGKTVVYNTFQLYRNDGLTLLKNAHQRAVQAGYTLGVKLVRGAYMEKERARALKTGYSSPIHENKAAVDEDYNMAIDFCLTHLEHITFCCASHNEESCLHLAQQIDAKGIARNHSHITFSQLYGMGDHITYNLAQAGFNSSKYIPYGPVKEVIPYLLRRAQENSSVAGQVGRELGLLQKEMKRRGLI